MRFLSVIVAGLVGACSIAGDYSRVPIPSKRVYGRVREQLLAPTIVSLRPVNRLASKDLTGKIVDSARVYGLIIQAGGGQGIVVYFTTKHDSVGRPIGIRQSAMKRDSLLYRQMMFPEGRRVPIGVTSAQMMFINPKTQRMETKVYRDHISAQLTLSPVGGHIVGQVLVVLPDMNRSFVCGAFKVPRTS
jgi:hypothetical protein